MYHSFLSYHGNKDNNMFGIYIINIVKLRLNNLQQQSIHLKEERE